MPFAGCSKSSICEAPVESGSEERVVLFMYVASAATMTTKQMDFFSSLGLKQLFLIPGRNRPFQMFVGKPGGDPASWGPVEIAFLQQIGFIEVLYGVPFLMQRRCKGFNAHRTAAVLVDNGKEYPPVHFIKAL